LERKVDYLGLLRMLRAVVHYVGVGVGDYDTARWAMGLGVARSCGLGRLGMRAAIRSKLLSSAKVW
jgi:hypothetical protein